MTVVFARGTHTGLQFTPGNRKTDGFVIPVVHPLTLEAPPAGYIPVEGHVGLRVAIGQIEAAAKKAAVRLWLVRKIKTATGDRYQMQDYGVVVGESGTARISGTGSDYLAEAMTATLSTFATNFETNVSKRASYASSVSGKMGQWFIPDLDNADGIVLEESVAADDVGGSGQATGAKAIYEFTT